MVYPIRVLHGVSHIVYVTYPIRVLHVNPMMGWWCMVNTNSSGCPSVPGIAWFDIAWHGIKNNCTSIAWYCIQKKVLHMVLHMGWQGSKYPSVHIAYGILYKYDIANRLSLIHISEPTRPY